MKIIIGVVTFLIVIGYCANIKQCDTDMNCSIVWDDLGSAY